ncbi:MAG TPA: hypothetical protein VFW62_13325 [bacterium]|nr:hypothetical protein [bacterium]
MKKTFILLLGSLLLLFSADGSAKGSSEYQSAKVLSLNESSVTRSQFVGESFGEVSFMSSRPYQARVLHFTIQLGEAQHSLVYEARPGKDYSPTFQTGDVLEVRIHPKKNKVYIKRPDGKTWVARMTE